MKTTPKDFFLHLGALVALYSAATALINLSFSVINYYFPDQLAGYFYGNAVAFPISVLIVAVPILYILEWLIGRDISKVPEKAGLWVRTWKLYIIIFSAIVLVAGDLMALLNTYFNGEISSRFVYKIIIILLIGGVVGKYYFFRLFPNMMWAKFSRAVHPWVGLILVIAAIVAGFIAFGSPATQRGLRFDTQRVNDLNNIQSMIINRWTQKGTLPAQLSDLSDSLSYYKLPADPETGAAYEYSAKGVMGTKDTRSGLAFELCATFSRATPDNKGRGAYGGYGGGGMLADISYRDSSGIYPGTENNNWTHTAGRTCFERNIDPDIYRPNPKMMEAQGI